MQVMPLARHRWSSQAWGKQGQSTTGGGVDNRSEASCLVSANPVFLTEPCGVDYWLEVVFLLIGLFETDVVVLGKRSASHEMQLSRRTEQLNKIPGYLKPIINAARLRQTNRVGGY